MLLILTHEPNQSLLLLTIYFLCAGSFYISYRLQENLMLCSQYQRSQVYLANLIVNGTIILLTWLFNAKLLHSILNIHFYSCRFIFFTLFAMVLGSYYVTLEAKLLGLSRSIMMFHLPLNYTLLTIVLLSALVEELLFRGIMLQIAMLYGGYATVLMLLFANVAFGLSHLNWGWAQMFSKFIFSLLMTALFFLSGSILAPVLAHLIFNYRVAKLYPQGVVKIWQHCSI